MTSFEERRATFEAKFAHDSEMKFKAEMRRNRLLAEWAGQKLGYDADRTAAYVKEVIKADFTEAGHDDVYRKLHADLGDRVSEADLRARMVQADAEAKVQLLDEA